MNIEEQAIGLKENEAEKQAFNDVVRYLADVVDEKYLASIILEVEEYAGISKKSGFLQGFDMALKICNGGLENAKN